MWASAVKEQEILPEGNLVQRIQAQQTTRWERHLPSVTPGESQHVTALFNVIVLVKQDRVEPLFQHSGRVENNNFN